MAETEFISREDELALIRRAQAGDLSARDQLLKAHYRYIYGLGLKHHRRMHHRGGYEDCDCITVAMIGAIEGTIRFDCDRGFRWNTFATWYIRKELQYEETLRGVITLPRGRGDGCTEEWHRKIHAAKHVASLDMPIGDGDDNLHSVVVGKDEWLPAADRDEKQWARDVTGILLKCLTKKHADMTAMHLGGKTLEDTAAVFGVTRERVRQIVKKSLLKLKKEADRRGMGNLFDTRETDAAVEQDFITAGNRRSEWREEPIADVAHPIKPQSVEKPVVHVRQKPVHQRPSAVMRIVDCRKRRTRQTGDTVSLAVAAQKPSAASQDARRVLDAVVAAFAGRR